MTKQQDLLNSYRQTRRHWRKWFACALAVFLCALFVITARVLDSIETRTRQDTINALQTVLSSTHTSTDLWLRNLYQQVQLWGEHPETVRQAELLAASATNETATLISHPAQRALQRILKNRSKHHIMDALQIVGTDGTIWAALDESHTGKRHLIPSRFPGIWEDVKQGNPRATHPVPSPYSSQENEDAKPLQAPAIFLLSPIMTPEHEVVAIMAFSIDPYEAFIPIIQAGRIGKTGETYAIDKTGRFITPCRFPEDLYHVGLVPSDEPIIFNLEARDPGAPLQKGQSYTEKRKSWPWTEAASSAIKQRDGESLGGIRDYRGIRVLSAWQWDKDLEIGLIAEINEQEALASFEQTRVAILILIVTVLALLAIIVLVLNQYVGIAKSNKLAVEAIHLAKASEEKFQSIFENVVEGIVCIDAYGHILEFNQAAERIFGYQSSETIGKNVSMLMPEPDTSQHDQYLHRYRQTRTKHIMGGYREVIGCRKDGTTFDMELALGEFRDNDNRFFVGLVRDISERKETERLLITARKKAEAANQAKSQFLSRMSHELRTPLNGILGFSTLLGMENLSPKNKKNVDRIQRSGKHLLRMINEVMNISNLEHHQKEIHLEPIPLKSVFDKAIAAMNPLASEKEVGIKVEELPSQNLSVWAHHDYLLQVIQNLISNGIKYNKPQGSLTLSVELLPDKRVKVSIADTGIGIPESKIERLFSPFDRLDAEREQSHIEGSGLGLTLTKSLIKAMKGTISVVSKEGQGTEFSIELAGVS